MADALDLLEIGGEQQDRQAFLQRLLEKVIDLRLRTHIDADGRLFEHEQANLRLHPTGDDDLLLIAAAQRGDHGLRILRLHRKALENSAAGDQFIPAPDRLQHAPAGCDRVHIDVLAYRHVGGEAFFRPAAGDEADLLTHGIRRTGRIDFLPVDGDVAGAQRYLAEDGPPDGVVPGAAQPDKAKRLAGGNGEGDRTDAFRHNPLDAHDGSIGGRRRLHEGIGQRAANDLLHQVRRRGFLHQHARNAPPVAQDGDAVGNTEHLVQPMGHIDDADAARPEAPQRVEQMVDIGLRQCGRGLIQD